MGIRSKRERRKQEKREKEREIEWGEAAASRTWPAMGSATVRGGNILALVGKEGGIGGG